jgi:uncharacterized protein (DUF2236 family)
LPFGLQPWLEGYAAQFLRPEGGSLTDFRLPAGEPALVPPESVAWQVFRNPVALFVGGVAAVLLELAEPRVRAGVWEHSRFRTDPVERLRRTGLAAMVTVYGASSQAEAMIAGVRRVHERVRGTAETGQAYEANDPELLVWVQATAMFGFLGAYHRYVRPLPSERRDQFYAEGRAAACLYGAVGAPRSEAELEALFEAMKPKLGRSPVIFEFLRIMRSAAVLPLALRPIQRLLLRAAVDILPHWFRELAGLGRRFGLAPVERPLVRQIGAAADRIRLDGSPAAEASVRLGLAADHLWKAAKTSESIRSSSPS